MNFLLFVLNQGSLKNIQKSPCSSLIEPGEPQKYSKKAPALLLLNQRSPKNIQKKPRLFSRPRTVDPVIKSLIHPV